MAACVRRLGPAGQSDGADGGLRPAPARSPSSSSIAARRPPTRSATSLRLPGPAGGPRRRPFVPRPNLRSLESHDWDERVADLQYRDVCEYAVGHNISTDAWSTTMASARPSAPAGFPRPRSSASPPPRSRASSWRWRRSPSCRRTQMPRQSSGASSRSTATGSTTSGRSCRRHPTKRDETAEELLKRAEDRRRPDRGGHRPSRPIRRCLEAFRIANE